MKKTIVPFLGSMLFFASCAKQENTSSPSPIGSETELTGQRVCASQEVLEKQLAEDPVRRKKLEDLEMFTQQYQGSEARDAGTLYVPVVVHVVMPNPGNVTDAQIQTQIDVLNKDFGKTNAEMVAATTPYLAGYSKDSVANCEIVFVRVQTVRKASTVATFGSNDGVKRASSGGSDAVDPATKLNIWVCDLSSGLLGYAQFPGGNVQTDGVVIDYQAFGTSATYPMYSQFNLGRTATHEVGHWFNLRHIWGDARCGTDFVGDTPAHDASNGGCPSTSHRSRCTGKPLEQWMNYMDYTDDRCMYMFSSGQKRRMDAAIDGARSSYVSTTSPL